MSDASGIMCFPRLYTDGGVAGKNPSPVGGSWAAIFAGGFLGDQHITISGAVVPSDLGATYQVVTNNNTELIAIVRGLKHMVGFTKETRFETRKPIHVYTDSRIAQGWMTGEYSTRMVPASVLKEMEEVAWLLSRIEVRVEYHLLAGHPTRQEIADGFKMKNGTKYPVAKENTDCDSECGKVCARLYKQYKQHQER